MKTSLRQYDLPVAPSWINDLGGVFSLRGKMNAAALLLFATLLMAGCGKRDISTPAEALVGHWRYKHASYKLITDKSKGFFAGDVYFSDYGKVVFVEDAGNVQKGDYRIESQDIGSHIARISLSSTTTDKNFFELQFSNDFKILKVINPQNGEVNCIFIDNDQSP